MNDCRCASAMHFFPRQLLSAILKSIFTRFSDLLSTCARYLDKVGLYAIFLRRRDRLPAGDNILSVDRRFYPSEISQCIEYRCLSRVFSPHILGFRCDTTTILLYLSRLHYSVQCEEIVKCIKLKANYTLQVERLKSRHCVNFKCLQVCSILSIVFVDRTVLSFDRYLPTYLFNFQFGFQSIDNVESIVKVDRFCWSSKFDQIRLIMFEISTR